MDPCHANLLTANLTAFTSELEVADVLPYLLQANVIMEQHVEELSFPNLTRQGKTFNLITLLKRRGPNAFGAFVNALHQTQQHHLVKLLKPQQENLGSGDARGTIERPEQPTIGTANQIISAQPPTYVDEVIKAQQYYKHHLPSYINDDVLNKVPQTSGVLTNIQIDGIDTATRFNPLLEFHPEDHYANFTKPKGLAIIFNNRRFRTLPARMGTDVDAANMSTLLMELGYQVKVKQDHTAREMLEALGRFAMKSELRQVDSVVVVVLTHGEHGQLHGSDDATVDIHDFTSVLNTQRCPALRGKPKLFFLQACRGKSYDAGDGANGNVVVDDYTDSVKRVLDSGLLDSSGVATMMSDRDTVDAVQALQLMIADNMAQDDVDAKQLMKRIPADADIFIGYATTPGYVSWRNSSRGSWYIETIINVFRKDTYHEDLLSMMTKVNRVVAETFASSSGGFKQIPEPCSRLTKKFYFFPGRFSPE